MSKSRPIDVAANVRTPSVHQPARIEKPLRKREGRRAQVRQAVDVGDKARRRLHGMSCRGVASWNHGRPQVSDAGEAVADAAHEQLPSPDRPIVTVARTVEGDTEHARVPRLLLGEHRRHVGVVMLGDSPLQSRQLQGHRGRRVLRVRIVRDEQLVGVDVVHPEQIVDRLSKRSAALLLLEVTDVLAYEGLGVDDERDCVLQVAADGKHWPLRGYPRDRARRVSSSSTQQNWPATIGANDRIVDTPGNRSVADEKRIGQPG